MNNLMQSSLYTFQFDMICSKEKFDDDKSEESDEKNEGATIDKTMPSFELEEFNYLGELRIKFSQKMEIPKNITEINKDVLEISLKIDESNNVEDETNLDFTWYV